MGRFILLFSLFLFQLISLAQVEIKSLRYFPEGKEKNLPVLVYGEGRNDRIYIEFDINSEHLPDLNIVFRYCDKNWKPVDNIFLLNSGQNIGYQLDYSLLPSTIQKAKYVFQNVFPDNRGMVTFPFSGKWMFFITDTQDTSKVYATGRFYVVIPETNLDMKFKKELLEDKSYYPLELGRIFNLTSSFTLSESSFPAFVTGMEVVENQKIFSPYFVDKSMNTNIRQFYWDGNRNFSFTIRDIKPGNEYRQTDLRNSNKFIGPNVKAKFDGIEYSRFDRFGKKDIDGSSELTNYKDVYADYLNVTFSLRPPSEITGDIFLTGSFNNWKLLPGYLMSESGGLYSKTIELKRGVYDYQYVTVDIINNKIQNENWIQLEGNFWETSNIYNIFIFYNDPNYGGYDKIIGYKEFRSN